MTLRRVIGHRDTGSTACPGNALYAPAGRAAGAGGERRAAGAGLQHAPVGALGGYRVDFGEIVPVSGSLLGADGAPVAGEAVELQVSPDGRWRTSRRMITAADGTFATELKPRLRMYVRTRFRGRSGLRGSGSTRLLLRLRPLITIDRGAVARAGVDAQCRSAGRWRRASGSSALVVQQRHRRAAGARSGRAPCARAAAASAPRSCPGPGATASTWSRGPTDDTDRGQLGRRRAERRR